MVMSILELAMVLLVQLGVVMAAAGAYEYKYQLPNDQGTFVIIFFAGCTLMIFGAFMTGLIQGESIEND